MTDKELYELQHGRHPVRYAGATTANPVHGEPEIATRNPAPDASEPAVPNGTYRELTLAK